MMKKRILPIFIVMCVLASTLWIAASAFGAVIYPLILDEMKTTPVDENKECWYSYTPVETGTYSFLSYNGPRTTGKLFIKELNPDTGKEELVQLVVAQGDKNAAQNGHNVLQFCLTYELEKGVTYYFCAVWWDLNTTKLDMSVKLRCDSYNTKIIDSIKIECPAYLSSYANGWWRKDSVTGEMYYLYDISRIKTNMKITVNFSNGDVKTVLGADSIGEYEIRYKHTQSENHWYVQDSSKYSKNILTVSILDVKVDFEVPIVPEKYAVEGKIVDYNGNPLKNIKIKTENATILTDRDGEFAYSAGGNHTISVTADNAIGREIPVTVSSKIDINDFSSEPVSLVACDYVNDGIINAKDYSFIIKNFADSELEKQQLQFNECISFTPQDYDAIELK